VSPKIIGLGERWLVVEKPIGMLAHPVDETGNDILSWVKQHLQGHRDDAKKCNYDPQYEIHPIHRLDREVGGLMLLALDNKRATILHAQFEARSIEKGYQAILHGNGERLEEAGEWNWKLTKKAEGRSKPAGFPKFRVACQTLYKVLAKNDRYTKVALVPHTGRKHQLRRHCAMVNMPIVGDDRYGRGHEDVGLQLVSTCLGFKAPEDNEFKRFQIEPTFDIRW